MISFQVITPDSFVVNTNGTLSGVTFAFPLILTVPDLIINWFPRPESTTALPATLTVPVPKTKGFFPIPVFLSLVILVYALIH